MKKLKAKNLVPVSDSVIYIMSDGVNSKIGITSNLEKRVSTYKTHNPTAILYSHYITPKAKEIELAIKTLFKDKTVSSSKEWFDLIPTYLDKVVSSLLQGSNDTILDVVPAMNKVPLTDDFRSLINKDNQIDKSNHERASEIFAREFNLGMPSHKLPPSVIKVEGLPIDLCEARDKNWARRDGYLQTNNILYNDHTKYFYHLVNLSSGKQIALCTSFVTMPYPFSEDWTYWEKEQYPKMVEDAKDRGYYVFRHDEWSWYNKGYTSLVLVMQKTPVSKRLSLWDTSFKKWVVEREKALEQEEFGDTKALKYAIEDICGGSHFPIHIQSLKEFADYMKTYWGINYYDKRDFELRDAFDFLFAKWKGVEWIPRIDPVVDDENDDGEYNDSFEEDEE